MKVTASMIADVKVIEPQVFGDERGFFFESFNRRKLEAALGQPLDFVQDNHSRSAKNVLRGLHYQILQPQAKLVQVVAGEIFDVVLDIRRHSSTFGRWVGQTLSADNKKQLWVPEGCAHGFLVMTSHAEVQYKTTDYWAPEHERCIAWNDPAISVEWPLAGQAPVLSDKDRVGRLLADAETFP